MPPNSDQAIHDHAPLIALIAEQLHTEAEALQACQDPRQRHLHVGAVAALSRIAFEEAQRLSTVLLASSPCPTEGELAVADEG